MNKKDTLEINFYIKLLDEFPALIWRSGIDAKCNYFNKAWLNFRGRKLEEEFGDGWAEGVHPDDLNACITQYLDSFNKKNPFTINYRLKRFDGEYRNLLDYGRPFYDVDGKFAGYIGSCYDITENINNENNLKKSFDDLYRLTAAVHQSPNTILITNLNGDIEFVNNKFTEVTGYTTEEVIGKNPRILKTEFLPPEAYSNLWKTISKGNTWKGEFLNKKKNGELYWEKAIISPVFDNKNCIINYIAIKEDITEIKKIQENLNSQESVNEAIAILSKEFLKSEISIDEISTLTIKSCIKISKSLLGLISLINEQTFNLECSFFTENNNIETINNQRKYIISPENGKFNSILGHAININNSFYSNNLSEFSYYPEVPKKHIPIFNFLAVPAIVNNKKIGVICLANKETGFTENDLKNAEKITNIFALAVYRKFTEKELVLAKIKAEESDKLKSSFLANMSHEIRTPMNAILGFAELLKKVELKPEKRTRYINFININCRSLNSLINDILDISRIETNSISIHNEEFVIGKILLELYEQFQLEINRLDLTSVELKLEIEEGLISKKIFSDLVRFKQILSNLIANAIKFTTKGSIIIGCKKQNNGFLKFYIKDTGIGIPSEAQSIIFERFRQEDGSITRNYGGSGLGLAISKSLINLLGGTIGVTSEKNIGSEFFITIPDSINLSQHIENKFIETLADENQKNDYNWLGKSLLIVDDDIDTQNLFTEIIDGYGLKLFVANTGIEALNICKNEKIDLILMDIHLPGMNGKETAQLILQNNKEIKIIAQTADVITSPIKEFKDLGFVDAITKPFNIEKVLLLLDNYLK